MFTILFVLIVYILTLGTDLYTSDGQVMYLSSRALVFDHTLALPEDYNLPQIKFTDHYYSQYDPGLPIIAAPIVYASDQLAKSQRWHRYGFAAFMVLWVSAIGAALAVGMVYRLAADIYPPQIALIVAFAAGFCTPLWVYSRLFFAEALLAGLITTVFWCAYRKQGLLAGIILGIAILTRAAMLIYLVPILWLLWRKHQAKHQLLLMGVGVVCGVLGLMYHNWVRSGNPLTFGYGGQAFDTPIYVGVLGLLFSSGKSVFLYAPPVLISVLGWRRFHRREPALAESLLLAALIAIPFYGSWWAWHGGWCWGARLLVPLMPLWVLPMGEFLQYPIIISHDGQTRWSVPTRMLIAGTILAGLLINAAGTLTDVNRHYAAYPDSDVVNYYEIHAAPLVGAVHAVMRGETIPLAAFHLQELGWVKSGAIAFPTLLCVFGFLLLRQIWKGILDVQFSKEGTTHTTPDDL